MGSESVESVAGPLGRYVEGFKRFLIDEEHYGLKPALKLAGLMSELSGWMAANGVVADALTEARAEEFTQARKEAGRSYLLSPRALIPLFGYLRGVGAVPGPVAAEPDAAGRLLACFADYLAGERGLARGTIQQYLAAARMFLDSELPGEPDLGLVTAAQVSEFVRARCVGRSPAAAGDLAWGLRSFLRFAHATGAAAADLSAAVPSMASRAGVVLPRGVDRATLAALFGSCDRSCLTGRRDYAVLLVLARLGLRAGEVAALGLDDVNWRAGVVVVRGKGNAVDTLPLPVDVGGALASYLSWEGLHRKSRTVFVRVRAPHGSLAPSSVSMIVYRACPAGRGGGDRRAPPAPQPGDRDAAAGRTPERSRPGTASPLHRHHRPLCQGRPGVCAAGGRPLAGPGWPAAPGSPVTGPWPGCPPLAGRGCVMTDLHQAIDSYIALRRGLGYQLRNAERALHDYADYLQAAGEPTVTTASALRWAASREGTTAHYAVERLSHVRMFARHLAAFEPGTEVPPANMLGHTRKRTAPHIYSSSEVSSLLAFAAQVHPEDRGAAMEVLIGLLAATGLRPGEAYALDRGDADLDQGVLTIRESKFHKSREVPLHESAVTALRAYRTRRDRWFPQSPRRRSSPAARRAAWRPRTSTTHSRTC